MKIKYILLYLTVIHWGLNFFCWAGCEGSCGDFGFAVSRDGVWLVLGSLLFYKWNLMRGLLFKCMCRRWQLSQFGCKSGPQAPNKAELFFAG